MDSTLLTGQCRCIADRKQCIYSRCLPRHRYLSAPCQRDRLLRAEDVDDALMIWQAKDVAIDCCCDNAIGVAVDYPTRRKGCCVYGLDDLDVVVVGDVAGFAGESRDGGWLKWVRDGNSNNLRRLCQHYVVNLTDIKQSRLSFFFCERIKKDI